MTQQDFWQLVLELYLINVISYVTVTRIFYTGVDIVGIRNAKGWKTAEKAIYLIGGYKSWDERQFAFLLDSIPEDTVVYMIKYCNKGFNPGKAAAAVSQHLRAKNHAQATFIAVGLGYQIAARAKRDDDKIIAIDPCIGRVSLTPWARKLSWLLPLGYLISAVLGWLSYLPVIKVRGWHFYSIKLTLDQLRACASSHPLADHPFSPDVFVTSRNDSILDNYTLVNKLVNNPKMYTVNTVHFGLVDNSRLYLEPIIENI